MPSFKLTSEQEAIVFFALDTARIEAENGKKGCVIGQIGYNKNGKNVYCDFGFIETDRANKIVDIVSTRCPHCNNE